MALKGMMQQTVQQKKASIKELVKLLYLRQITSAIPTHISAPNGNENGMMPLTTNYTT